MNTLNNPEDALRLSQKRLSPDTMVLVAILMLALSTFAWTDPGVLVDDATITYRYAVNIAQGQGFVYNSREPVLGTSTPLYALLLSGLASFGIPPVKSGHAIGVVSGLLVIIVVYILGRELGGWMAGAGTALLLATSAHFAANVSSGMETPLYVLLIQTTFLLFYQGHFALAAFTSGLCVLARLDGLAVPAVILLAMWIKKRRVPWRETGIVAVTLFPWLVFAQIYFGSPIPWTMIAKQHHTKIAGSLWMIRFLTNTPFEIVLIPIQAFFGTLLSRSNRTVIRTVPVVIWLILYVCAYSIVDIDAYDWYNVPPIPVLYLLYAVAIVEIVGRLDFPQKRRYTSVVLLLFGFSVAYQAKYDIALIPNFKRQAIAVQGTRVQVGEWLRENTPSDAVIATGAIGHIGYYSERYIADLAGLVTPYALGRPYMDTLDHFEADYVVLTSKNNQNQFFGSSDFLARYQLVREWDGSQRYVGSHVLFKRREE